MKHIYNNKNFGENWCSDIDSFYIFIVNLFSSESHFVEVGSWKGKSSACMVVEIINSNKKIKFDCVDTWEPIQNKDFYVYKTLEEKNQIETGNSIDVYDIFLNNMKPLEKYYTPIKMDSVSASKLYADESLDFIFLDACHLYECISEDIKHWFPKLKKNGIIAGHDFCPEWPGVEQAVKENFKDFELRSSIWMVKK